MAAPFGDDDDDDDPSGREGADAPKAPPQGTTLKVGAAFHLFHVVRLIGRGGASEVYEILFKGARWALKVPRRGFELTAEQRMRFEQEAQNLLRILHPNVIDLQDYGFNEGVFWMRMELLDGLDLREAITRLGAMSVGLVGAWLVQAAYGVHQCHEFGLVHRDLKPENVFITRDNVVKILDFGIVKHEHAAPTMQTGQGTAAPIGTAPYMSPEQARCSAVASTSDVYALGMMMWEMLVGEHPFLLGGAPYEFWGMLQKQVLEPVPPLTEWGFPPQLSGVAERALSKQPADRQPNGLSFADELLSKCKAYLRAHPEEEPNPGEPTIAWLLNADIQVPSFGTGPQSGRRPSVPPPRGSKPPEERVPVRQSAAPRPLIRFGTLPLGSLLKAPPQPVERDTEPAPPPTHIDDASAEGHERDTDPSGEPLEIRQFDTISLPPELRDPTAIRALAAYRPARPRSPGGALTTGGLAATRSPSSQDTSPAAADRAALLPGAAPATDPASPKQQSPASHGAAGEGQARAGTPTAAVVSVPPRPAPRAATSSRPQAPAPKVWMWERGALSRFSRRLVLPAVLVVGGVAVALALTLEVRVRRPVVEAEPSPALPPAIVSAATTATPGPAATSDATPNPGATGSAATAVALAAPAAEPSASAVAPLALRSSVGAAAPPASFRTAAVAPAPPRSTSGPAAAAVLLGQGTPAAGPKPRSPAPAASSSAPSAPAPSAAPHRVFGTEN
jgi:serine/threonine-protein kinase